MNFTLDNTQKGRPCLIYKNQKYRLKRTLVSGDMSWCCLGKNCGASVRTDASKTTLTVCNEKHSGPHPVTLRSLTPKSTGTTPNTRSPSSSMDRSLIASPLLSQLFSRKSVCHTESQTEEEHMKTKDELVERISQLTYQQDCLVLQCQSLHMQLEEKDRETEDLRKRHVEVQEAAIQTEVTTDTSNNAEPCQRCVILGEEAHNMIQAIRTLETENGMLQRELRSRVVDNSDISSDQACIPPRSPINLSNSFSALSEETCKESQINNFTVVSQKPKRKRTSTNKKKNIKSRTKKAVNPKRNSDIKKLGGKSPFKLHVFADSHGKDLHKYLTPKMPAECDVFVDACSGAPLSHVLSNVHSMIRDFSKRDTAVVVAGANDIGDVTPQNSRLARVCVGHLARFVRQHRHTNFVVVSLFHQHHQQWNSYSNREVKRVNAELQELQQDGVTVVDVSGFSRRLFTRHGQHLNSSGKRVLCNMIAASVQSDTRDTKHQTAQPAADLVPLRRLSSPVCVSPTSSPQRGDLLVLRTSSSEPTGHHHDTYAAAVKSPSNITLRPDVDSLVNTTAPSELSVNSLDSSDIFLSHVATNHVLI